MSNITINEDNSYILEMINISKSFPGVRALDEVNLRVKKGSVHALMGENGAGKSTLMKCLFGIYYKDEGEIYLDGRKIQFSSSKDALDHGVSMVHQELNQVRQRNVMDNLWLGRYPYKGVFVDEKKMYKDTLEIFKQLNIYIDPKTKVNALSVSQMQMLEIAKAVSYNSKIIVMDEPTSSLTEKEVIHLFSIIDKLKAKGISIIYISHKMDEILKISDEVTIMRDGKWVTTQPTKSLTMDMIIKKMVGREINSRFPPKSSNIGTVVLEVKNLTGLKQPSLIDVSFNLNHGEILGIAGLVGAKRTEILEAIFGMRKISNGKIVLNGKELDNSTTFKAMRNGFSLVTEERRETGIFPHSSISFNSVIANMRRYVTFGFLSNSHIEADTEWVIESMNVKTPSQKTHISSLSGGNQQKVIIGRWLLTNPEILMLDEPTRGIDVGAKYEIYQLMNKLAEEGKSILMVSSEMPELLGVCHRILVMSNGRVAGIVNADSTSQEEIMHLSALYL